MDLIKTEWDFEDRGELLLVDKPLDWSSFDAVKKIKVLFHVRKVGHAGTLDPKATGLLIVCTGRKTKTLDSFQSEEKEYIGSFELGARTPSFDSETQVIETNAFEHITEDLLQQAVKKFTGKMLQTPPMFSAAKFDGKPLYLYARKGKSVERVAKEIEILDFQVTGFVPPMIGFKIVCSKGTYIRTLVEDLGIELGCGCTLRSLRRTRIGSYRVEDALSIEDLIGLRKVLESRQQQAHEVSELA